MHLPGGYQLHTNGRDRGGYHADEAHLYQTCFVTLSFALSTGDNFARAFFRSMCSTHEAFFTLQGGDSSFLLCFFTRELEICSCNRAVECYNTSAMISNLTPIDISDNPELLRLAEEVEATKTPRKLIRDKKTIAVIMPVSQPKTKKQLRTSVKEALALAGAWGDRDWNEVEAELERIRHSSKPTPPFEL